MSKLLPLLGCGAVATWTLLQSQVQVTTASSMKLNPFQTGDKFVLDAQHPAIKFEMNTKYAVPDGKGKIQRFTSGKHKWHYTWKKSWKYSWKYSWNTATVANGTTITNFSNTTTNSTITVDTNHSFSTGSHDGSNGGGAKPLAATSKPTNRLTTRRMEDSSTDLDRLRNEFGNVVVNTKHLPVQGAAPISPWPGSYWPSYLDGINNRWNRNQPSPSEKYAQAFNLNVKSSPKPFRGSKCVRRGNGPGLCVPIWFGICHAWSVAAMLEPEPQCAITVNHVRFEPKDIKGLVTQFYDDAGVSTVFLGVRYDGGNDALDRYGRFVDAAYRDIGPGMFHIATTNIMGLQRRSFLIDVDAGPQVWNHPVRGYKIVEHRDLTPAHAAQQFFRVNEYPFNNAAQSIQYVRMRLSYILETEDNDPKVSTGQIDTTSKTVEYTYLLELDASNNIVGGEWVGESRRNHPDFLWFPTSRPNVDKVSDVGLTYAHVKDLVQKSQTCDLGGRS